MVFAAAALVPSVVPASLLSVLLHAARISASTRATAIDRALLFDIRIPPRSSPWRRAVVTATQCWQAVEHGTSAGRSVGRSPPCGDSVPHVHEKVWLSSSCCARWSLLSTPAVCPQIPPATYGLI